MAQETNEELLPAEEGTPAPEEPIAEPGAEPGPIEGEITEEAAPVTEIEVDAAQFPELATMQVGDPVSLEISEISEDGSKITLIPSIAAIEPEGPPAELPEVLPGEGGGREAVEKQLLGS